MKIAHFLMGRCNPESANGVDKTIYHLSIAQARLGEEVAVFSVTDKEPLEIPGVQTFFFRPGRSRWEVPRKLWGDLLSWRPEVVQLHSVYVPANVRMSKALRRARIPYVVTPHGGLSPFVTARGWWKKLPYKFLLERPMLRKALFVHSVGDVADIRDYCGEVSVVVAPNAIANVGEAPQNARRDLESRYPALKGNLVFLFLGRMDLHTKGLDILLDAFQGIAGERAVLLIVGPDFRGDGLRLRSRASGLGIAEKVIFLGPVHGAEKVRFLAAADVFVHPSRHEGLSSSVLEACSLGLPCLVTPAADPLGRISQKKAGIICEPQAESILHALRLVLKMSGKDLHLVGEAARSIVTQEFTWERSSRALLDAFRTAGVPHRVMDLSA